MSERLRRQKVIESNPLVEILGGYLPLRRDGPGFRSLCPFHDDHDFTLNLDLATKSFKCSACEASGDIVDFVRLYEGVTVSEALDILEARAD
jgi:DNA primase